MFGALITGILFAIFMWIGDEFILDDKNPFYVYLVYALVFAVAMFSTTSFSAKRNKKPKKNLILWQ
jgi:O-antigen/teichoic acid export membrane protein